MYASAPYRTLSDPPEFLRRSGTLALVIAAAMASLSSSAPPAVVITRLTDLEVGNVSTSETRQILYADGGAASFRIDATGIIAQLGIDLAFTLPNQLSSGGNSIDVSFSGTSAAWSYSNAAAGATAFDPSAGTSVPKDGANFTVYVWVGASVTTIGASVPDTYTNTLILDAEAL